MKLILLYGGRAWNDQNMRACAQILALQLALRPFPELRSKLRSGSENSNEIGFAVMCCNSSRELSRGIVDK